MKKFVFLAFVCINLFSTQGFSKKIIESKVDFLNLKNNATVTSPVKILMTVEGLKVRPAGEDINDKSSGHHHIIINASPIPEGQVVPADENHIHFGKGQTETSIELKPGKHTLTLQFADGAHRSYGPKLSKTIHITVIK